VVYSDVLARPTADQIFSLDKFGSKISLVFSLYGEQQINVPSSIIQLADDTSEIETKIQTTGKSSKQLIHKGPYLDVKSISGHWEGFTQIRKKISNTGNYANTRTIIFRQSTSYEKDFRQSYQLLNLFLRVGCWKVNGYHKFIGFEDSLILEFDQLCKKKNRATKSMLMNSENLIIADK
jgi:hypothetical protein